MQFPDIPARGPKTDLENRIGAVFRRIPILPEMTDAERAEARRARDNLADNEFTDPVERQAAADQFIWMESFERRVHDDFEGIPDANLWLPVSAKDYLSGYFPVEAKPLGEGAAARVYKCRTRFGGFLAVVKLMTLSDPERRIEKMLAIRELQTIMKLSHPNIVRVFDAGRISVPDGRGGREDYPFVSMEFLEGVTLWHWVVDNFPLDGKSSPKQRRGWERKISEVGAVLADTLAFCHRQGFTHGDLHGRNVHVCGAFPNADNLKVYDFGFATGNAERVGGVRSRLGETQTAGQRWKALMAHDIRSLGETVYSCLTKQSLDPLPQDATRNSALESHLAKLESVDLKAILRMALLTGISDEGYETISHLAEDLRAVAELRPVPHARRDDYTFLEQEQLVWLRARVTDAEENQHQVIARLAVIVGGLVSANGLLHAAQVYLGVPSVLAFERSNTPVLALALSVFSVSAWWTRGRFATLRIVEPLAAFVLCCVCLLYCIMPDIYATAPDLNAINSSCLVAIMLVGVINICFGTLSNDWKAQRAFGWAVLASTFLLRPVFDSGIKPYAGPEIGSAIEAVACFLFARRLWNSGATKPVPNSDT